MVLGRRRRSAASNAADEQVPDESIGYDELGELDGGAENGGDRDGGDRDGGDDGAPAGVVGGEFVATASGPWDVAAAPDDGLARVDLGALHVPVLPQTELRVELNEQQQPIAATFVHAGSTMQLLVFAAPRGEGIWDEVRTEIAESIRAEGGSAEEHAGPLGVELQVRAAVAPGAATGEQHLRFLGFDGPRWFLRAVFTGPASTNPQQAVILESVLTSCVVVRGQDPMAPRDLVPLRLPTQLAEAAAAHQQAEAARAAGEQSSIDPFTRGPEITETR